MMKTLIIGLDLSFNSTGITIYAEDNKLSFHRVVYETSPRPIANLNQYTYKMPSNIQTEELLISTDKNTKEQLESTIRAMICSKQICKILSEIVGFERPDNIIVVFENYIMPSFGGKNSLKNVSGLILLQGYIREWIIKLAATLERLNIKIMTPSPSSNKKFFTGNGKADKKEMLDVFLQRYDGHKLLPEWNVGKIDDVIDSFALMCQGLFEYRNSKMFKSNNVNNAE